MHQLVNCDYMVFNVIQEIDLANFRALGRTWGICLMDRQAEQWLTCGT